MFGRLVWNELEDIDVLLFIEGELDFKIFKFKTLTAIF